MTPRARTDRLASMGFFAIGVPATLVVPAMCAVLIYKAAPGHLAEIIPLLLPSLAIAAISLAFSALPGLGTALYTSEFLQLRWRRRVSILLEGLGALPPVCCAWFAIALLPDWWERHATTAILMLPLAVLALGIAAHTRRLPWIPEPLQGVLHPFFVILCILLLFSLVGVLPTWHAIPPPPLHSSWGAGIAISGFLAPKIAARSLAQLAQVPSHLREASLSCGATRWETVCHVVLPQAIPGLTLVLWELFAWVLGETMVVLVLFGASARPPWNSGTLGTAMTLGLPDVLAGSAAEGTLVWPALLLLLFSVLAQLPGILRERRP